MADGTILTRDARTGVEYPVRLRDNSDGTYSPVTYGPAILESGVTELIGVDERVDQNEYSGSVAVPLAATCSGEIVQVTLISRQAGAPLTPQGTLFFLDADPAVSPGDTAMTAAEHLTVIGRAAHSSDPDR